MKLFLDDIRTPEEVFGYINAQIYKEEWWICRNYTQFIAFVRKANVLITHISFDHDLGEDEAKEKIAKGMSKRKARGEKKLAKSGYDCAKWLIEYCIEREMKLPAILIHTANPVGRKNLEFLFNNYKKHCE